MTTTLILRKHLELSNPDDETAHGTHVSGTVAANGTIKGVAPEAKLLAYRVLGPGGSGTTENVIAGIEQSCSRWR